MLAHLKLLTIKAISYLWVSVRAFHKFIVKQVEQCRLDWQNFKSIQDQATSFFSHSDLQTSQPRALGYLPTPHPLAIIHKRLHPLFPRLVELVIILAFVTAISKMLMLIRNIINAECARLIILLYIVLNVVHQFPGNDSYLATPLTLRPLWPRTDTDTNLSTLQLSYDIYM